MRYLVLSDIHSNLEALEACLRLAEGKYDDAVCLGDLVGYGPDPNAVIERVRSLARAIIRGNHDKACSGIDDAEDFNPFAYQATLWTREQLTAEHYAFLRALPEGPIEVSGFAIVHGSPLDEDEYILGPREALPALKSLTIPIVCFGHTHYQGGFALTSKGRYHSIRLPAAEDGLTFTLPLEAGGLYLLNPGSIGQPRDGDWRAAFAILDEGRYQMEYYRTAYDLETTQKKMARAGLPQYLIQRLSFGR